MSYQNFAAPSDTALRQPRLQALRSVMRQKKLGALIIPKQDEFMGEYVPPSAERLAWATGFTGSAGLCVVLAKSAILFVDGRYTLQAKSQADAKLFAVQSDFTQWLQTAPKNMRIGYASNLHTPQQTALWQKTAQAQWCALPTHPIDALWNDRPAPPQSAIVAHSQKYAGESSHSKRTKIAQDLRAKNLSAVLLSDPASVAWLLNIRAHDVPHTPVALTFALLHATGKVDWFIDSARVPTKLRQALGENVRLSAPAKLLSRLRQSRQRIAYDPSTTAECYVAALASPVPMPDPTALPRATKNRTEQTGMRNAHIRDGVALCQFLHWLETHKKPTTLTEISAAEKLEQFRKDTGALQDLSFDTISGAGPNGAIVHYRVTRDTDRRLRQGDIYLCDSGGQYLDGTTDVTRSVLVGKAPAKPALKEVFTRVLAGHINLAQAQFPAGTTGHQLDALARAPLWEAGLDFAHGTGHGVGSYLSVHEGPQNISPRPSAPLVAGMVLSNEPGFYQKGQFGIRIENLMLVVPARKAKQNPMLAFETLTLAPIERRLIATKFLTSKQILWLNAYHSYVEQKIAPHLNRTQRIWLHRICRPL